MLHALRPAAPADGEALLKIYAPYIAETAVSFETEVPSVQEFSRRIAAICGRYPYLVYEADGQVVGYAYASRHRERDAYRYDVDVSIYVLPKYHGMGVAHRLYGCLFSLLKELGYVNAYAAYTLPNEKSRRFHEKFGFSLIGIHHNTGYKLGRWHDVAWLEKSLAEPAAHPTPVKSIGELSKDRLEAIVLSYLPA